jgi:hypothetical protein
LEDDGMVPEARIRKKSKLLWIGLAFVLLLALLVAFLPSLAGGLVASRVEAGFAERFEGRLQLGSIHLAWRERQRVESAQLFAPDGQLVAQLSLELPSILELARSGGTRLGLFTAQLDARLVADEQGSTNLQRALAPRALPAAPEEPASGGEPLDPAQLEFEFVLQAPRLAWSDATTRAAGADFEISDLWLRIRAERGKALDLELRGAIGGSGVLQGRAQIEGLSTDLRRPFARATALFDVQGLACGLVDGLAQTNGELTALIGASADLSLALDVTGLESGSAKLGLAGQRAQLQLALSLQDRILRLEGERGAELNMGLPLAHLKRELAPYLPPGCAIDSTETDLRVTVRLPKFETRLDLPAQSSAADWSRFAAQVQAQLQVAIPGPLSFVAPALSQANLRPIARDLMLRGSLSPGKPTELGLSMLLDTGSAGTLKFNAALPELFDALAQGREPTADLRLEVTDLSNAFLEALAGQGEFLTSGIGQALDIDVSARSASKSGADLAVSVRSARFDLQTRGRWTPERFTAAGEDGVDLLFNPEPQWWSRLAPLEIAGHPLEFLSGRLRIKLRSLEVPLDFADVRALESGLSASLQADLPGIALRGKDAAMGLHAPKLHLSVARGGTVAMKLESKLAAAGPSRVDLLAELKGWSGLLDGRIPSWNADFALDELDLAAVQSFTGLDLALVQRLGERADLRVRADQLDEQGGKLFVSAQSPKWKLDLEASGADRRFQLQAGLEGLLTQSDLEAECARFAPSDLQLSLLDPTPFALRIESAQVRLPEREHMAEPKAWMDQLAVRAQLAMPAIRLAAPALESLGLEPSIRLHQAALVLSQGNADLQLDCEIREGGGKYAALAGTQFALRARADGWLEQQRFDLDLSSERMRLALRGTHRDRRIELPGEGLSLKWSPDPARAREELQALLPESLAVEFLQPDNSSMSVEARDFAARMPAEGETWWMGLGGELLAELPGLVVRLGGETAVPFVLASARLSTRLDGQMRFDARLKPDGSGSLVVEASPRAPLETALRDLGPFQLSIAGSAIPLGALDALVTPAGLLTEMLGSEVELKLESPSWSLASSEVKGWVRSPSFAVELEGVVGREGLRVTRQSGVTASFGLGPLSSERFLGGVLPMLCAVQKPSEAKPARLAVNKLEFPLGDDLSKLDADLTLELGEIQYAWLPGLAEALGSGATAERTRLASFPIRIQQGVVRYEQLPLKLAGREIMFNGSYQLVDQKMALSFSVPLEILGKKVSKELEKARDFLDPKLVVPLEIRGTPSSPKLSLGKGFLESVVKKALEKQLQKGLESLFSDEEKKPKKP